MVKNINTLLIIYLYAEEYFVIHLCRNQFRVLLDIDPIETTELKNRVERLIMYTTSLLINNNQATVLQSIGRTNRISIIDVSINGNS